MACMHLLCFSLDDRRYALELDDVRKVLRAVAVSPLPDAPEVVLGLINVRGRILPVIDLRRRLGLPASHMGLENPLLWVLAAGRELLLPVDRVEGVKEFDDKDVLAPALIPEPSPLVKALARLPDGILLIQDLAALLSLGEREALEHAIAGL